MRGDVAADRKEQIWFFPDEINGQAREALRLALGVAVGDGKISSFDVA
jgi:hypothetical protein